MKSLWKLEDGGDYVHRLDPEVKILWAGGDEHNKFWQVEFHGEILHGMVKGRRIDKDFKLKKAKIVAEGLLAQGLKPKEVAPAPLYNEARTS